MTRELEILTPKKGHYFDLSVLVLGLCAFLSGLAYAIYDFVFLGGEEAPYLIAGTVLILMVLPVVYVRPGRYVVIDRKRGISTPMIIRRSDPRLVQPQDIQWYTKVYSISDKETVIGVIILTAQGKKIRYSDRKTPGCSVRMLKVLEENHVQERIPEKIYLG